MPEIIGSGIKGLCSHIDQSVPITVEISDRMRTVLICPRKLARSAMSDPQLVSSLPLTAASSLLMSNDSSRHYASLSEVMSSAGQEWQSVNVPLEEYFED
jgi:hypothetical protein